MILDCWQEKRADLTKPRELQGIYNDRPLANMDPSENQDFFPLPGTQIKGHAFQRVTEGYTDNNKTLHDLELA